MEDKLYVREIKLQYTTKKVRVDKINNPKDIHKKFKWIADNTVECFYVLYLNNKNFILGFSEVHKGTTMECLVHPREIFRTAVHLGCSNIVVIHNHPSDQIKPSPQDFDTTNRIKEAGHIIGIPLLDHMVITSGEYFSFKEEGYL